MNVQHAGTWHDNERNNPAAGDERPDLAMGRAARAGLTIVGALLLSAIAVAFVMFNGALAVLATFVGFLLMLMIGAPLIIASINDATESSH